MATKLIQIMSFCVVICAFMQMASKLNLLGLDIIKAANSGTPHFAKLVKARHLKSEVYHSVYFWMRDRNDPPGKDQHTE